MGTWLPQNMWRIEINIHENLCVKLAYLQRSYQNVRSTKHKILVIVFSVFYRQQFGETRTFCQFPTHGDVGVCCDVMAVNISSVNVLCLPPETNGRHLNVALCDVGGKLREICFSLFVV